MDFLCSFEEGVCPTRSGFLACAAEENLRFKVGDTAEAKGPGGWMPATVIKLWDEGNPYRIKVQPPQGKPFQVWAPLDDSRFIRVPGTGKGKGTGTGGY